MVFSSIEFIYFFLPLFLLIYYMLPATLKNAGLFLGSMVFYTIGSLKTPEYVLLFALSLVVNFCFGRLIERYETKTWFVLGIGFNLIQLGLFKYVMRVLPIGISFYTFQAISYLCDVQRQKCTAEKSLINFGTYLSMFPQLIAGPIDIMALARLALSFSKTGSPIPAGTPVITHSMHPPTESKRCFASSR